jgi:hypothetical protein
MSFFTEIYHTIINNACVGLISAAVYYSVSVSYDSLISPAFTHSHVKYAVIKVNNWYQLCAKSGRARPKRIKACMVGDHGRAAVPSEVAAANGQDIPGMHHSTSYQVSHQAYSNIPHIRS